MSRIYLKVLFLLMKALHEKLHQPEGYNLTLLNIDAEVLFSFL